MTKLTERESQERADFIRRFMNDGNRMDDYPDHREREIRAERAWQDEQERPKPTKRELPK